MSRVIAITAFTAVSAVAFSQQYLSSMPGYDRYSTQPAKLRAAAKIARINVTWNADSKAFFFSRDGKRYKFDIATRKEAESNEEAKPAPNEPTGRNPGGNFGRGQQPGQMASPDGNWTILYRKRNLFLKPKSGDEVALTTDATDINRLDYGSVTWTYNEELNQHLPFWWSSDSKKVAYYRFDESKIPDYFMTPNAAGYTNSVHIEPYPKAGFENPVVDIFIYDIDTKKTIQVDTRDGGAFTNDSIGHYVYGCEFAPNPNQSELSRTNPNKPEEFRFFRSNRRQNKIEWCAAAPATGKVRVIAREENPGGWCNNAPARRFLKDGNRFFWTTERNGFANLDLMDLSGKRLETTTSNPFEFVSIVKIDEAKKTLWYLARGGDTMHKLQLYRCQFDGSKNVRLTNVDYTHSVQISPDGNWFVDTRQTADEPPVVEFKNKDGMLAATLAKSDLTEYFKLGAKTEERVNFKSADGKFDLYGRLSFPSNFDPSKKYPVLVQTYNGPDSNPYNENFTLSDDLAELGFIVASFESRGGGNRGREFNNTAYMKLGTVEIDDLAAGIKAINSRPYVRADRVGIFGTSYGGYTSLLCLLRYPDLFAAASASSAVTDWRHYDTIYTERYMWIPQENKEGYDAGSAMTYAKNLKGSLLLYFGTMDDNVHPANTMAIIRALQRERKSFEVQLTPDAGHSGVNFQRMLEFFIQNLVMKP